MNIRQFSRGVLSGCLIGDCYGYVFEDRSQVGFEKPMKLLAESLHGNCNRLIYTDDSQMALAILRSIREQGELDPSHLAREHARDYFDDGSHRYYGAHIGFVFRELEKDCYKNPFKFAADQFNGSGSFGNGGAMRISPLSVYALNFSPEKFDQLIIDAVRLTHTHPLGVCGALLQSFAVCEVWSIVSSSATPSLDPDQFLDNLLTRLSKVNYWDVDFTDPKWSTALESYRTKFESIKQLLSASKSPQIKDIVRTLGNNLRAINSVPLSIYAFLRSLTPIKGIPYESIPLRCLIFTIGLGGDTDSNASMACGLAGGYAGLDVSSTGEQSNISIPSAVLARCERSEIFEEFAEWIAKRHVDG